MCANSVGVCVHQMNKYLPHAYILKRTERSQKKEMIFKIEHQEQLSS